ncbi:MAG: 30S ribosomal protein S11 [Cyanobacteria bacterium P01_H01_bin.74]
MAEKTTRSKRKDKKKNIPHAIVHIQSTFNNTIVCATDPKGNVIAWSSAGAVGFKGARKGTPFAAQSASEVVAKLFIEHGGKTAEIRFSGPGSGRETSVRAISASGIEITSLRDVTAIPHNGCRPPKRRRV